MGVRGQKTPQTFKPLAIRNLKENFGVSLAVEIFFSGIRGLF
jgi:hypothetical protein